MSSDPASTGPAASAALDALLADLTEPQQQAVQHVEGPLLVLAGAGSGKTRTITRRIAYLVKHVGVAPWQVLAITFTNKAAGEMRERVGQLLTPRQARALSVSTFHSFCARVIRDYAERVGLTSGYSIYDSADQQRAMKQCLKEAGHAKASNFPPRAVLGTISNAKNAMQDAAAFAADASDFYTKQVAILYKHYERLLQRSNALDFDDLLLRTVQLLQRDDEVRAELQDRFQFLLIDEYQDTNHAQFCIAHALAQHHQNICATGDPDQSIYGWRGADIHNILDFEEHFPHAVTIRLEQNYRSSQRILHAADGLIQQNKKRKHKGLWTENPEGEKVRVLPCPDETAEAEAVARWMQELRDEHQLSWSDFAVFYRQNSLSRVIEERLRHSRIPHQIARGTAFYDRKEIKDAVAYLRSIANPTDEINLLRIINTPARGISDKTQGVLQAESVAQGTTIDALMGDAAMLEAKLNTRAVKAVGKFAEQLDTWRAMAGFQAAPAGVLAVAKPVTLSDLVSSVLEDSGLNAFYAADKSDPDEERVANLGELINAAASFERDYDVANADDSQALKVPRKLEAFLESIALVSDADTLSEGEGAVSLMTLHAAKGLEFPAVAMIGLEDGLLPHIRSQRADEESGGEAGLEEERRLCFVGITRAQRFLQLSYARYRTVFGETTRCITSRFLKELPSEAVELFDDAGEVVRGDERGDAEAGTTAMAAGEFAPGVVVQHDQFGVGKVQSVVRAGSHTRAKIDFIAAGTKTLILEFARLRVVEKGG